MIVVEVNAKRHARLKRGVSICRQRILHVQAVRNRDCACSENGTDYISPEYSKRKDEMFEIEQ